MKSTPGWGCFFCSSIDALSGVGRWLITLLLNSSVINRLPVRGPQPPAGGV